MSMDQKKIAGLPRSHRKIDYGCWHLEWLAHYIEKLQRKTIEEKSGLIMQNFRSFSTRNDFVIQLENSFRQSVCRLQEHMLKEEQHLFPFIREIVQAKELKLHIDGIGTARIEALIHILNDEHANEKIHLNSRAELRANCMAASKVNAPLEALLTSVAGFDQACQLHMDLQYDFLFPKVRFAECAAA